MKSMSVKTFSMLMSVTRSMPSIIRKRRTALTLWVSVLGMVLLAVWLARRAPADTVPQDAEIDAALQATLNAFLTNRACPKDPIVLQEAVAVAFPMLYPELANRRQSPAPAAGGSATDSFLDPWAYQAAQLQDPAVKARQDEALRTLTQGLPQ